MWPAVIASHVSAELPFMATEVILMTCVKRGSERGRGGAAITAAVHEEKKEVVEKEGEKEEVKEVEVEVEGSGDRQVLHEAIRQHTMEAGRRVKQEGASNDLLSRIAGDFIYLFIYITLPH